MIYIDYFMESARVRYLRTSCWRIRKQRYKNNECVNTIQSTFHAVICLFYTYWDFSTPTRFSPFIRQNKYQVLLYSWRFTRYSASFHWLVHGHMTSNNETVSRQMPWVGNIAKTMTSNGKQFTVTRSTVHCWPLLQVMAGISARFSNFAFVLFFLLRLLRAFRHFLAW